MATKDFIEYDPTNGNQNEVINVTANKNTSSARSTSLSIYSNKGLVKIVNINQEIGHSSIIAIGKKGNISLIQLE